MSRRSRKRKEHGAAPSGRGFDLGDQLSAMTVADVDFREALFDAEIFACAYGFSSVNGFPGPIPTITLVGSNETAFRRAFERFSLWGSQADGDVVDFQFLLLRSGGYDLLISPEITRASLRLAPQPSLYNTMSFVASYGKHFDGVNPTLREFIEYSKRPISPILFSAGVAPNASPARVPTDIKHLDGLPEVLKFGTVFIDEVDTPEHPFFQRSPQRETSSPPSRFTPEVLRSQRGRVLDVAFPVSRERLRRTTVPAEVRAYPLFESVTDDQILQAVVNLTMSDELVGQPHYQGISDDLRETIWDYVLERVEVADNSIRIATDASATCTQIDLDVRYALQRFGAPTSGARFKALQAEFLRRGFGNG